MNFPYEDIVNMPHHVSTKHPQMPREDRAAQFAPFAALTGHGEAIAETARLTDDERDLSDEEINELNARYQILAEHIAEQPEIIFTFFVPDSRKEGGEYVTVKGNAKKIDGFKRVITLADSTVIPFRHLLMMDGEVFRQPK